MNFDRRHLLANGLTIAASAPFLRAVPVLGQPTPYKLPLSLVHPELRAAIPMVEQFSASDKPLTRASLEAIRKPPPAAFARPALPNVVVENKVIPVGGSHPDVTIYVINAKAGTSRPAILHTHGGGYVSGSAKDAIRQLQDICKTLDCVAVSVDYRLAPETTYKGSIEDNYAGLKWLHANAAAIGADPAKIAVLGESAGGGHAAILAITARDRGEVPLAFQCLIYPMLDDRTGTTRKMAPHVGTLIWNAQKNHFGWQSFLGQTPGQAKAPLAAVPARVENLKGLPPAFIGVGTLDLFHDEDVDYAQRLNAAGISTELIVVPGAYHGFDGISMLLNAPLGKWFDGVKLNALRRGFGMPAV
jgi:acetyl esterase/lipase